jgi:hypothetical protein
MLLTKNLTILLIFTLISCEDKVADNSSSNNLIAPVTEEKCDSTTIYSGISSISNITDTTVKISWDLEQSSIGYILFREENNQLKIVKKLDSSTPSFTVPSLEAESTYRFLLRTVNNKGSLDCNENFHDVQTTEKRHFISCNEIHTYYQGAKPSGVYELDTDLSGTKAPFNAYCDMDNNGGGWTKVFNHDTTAGLFLNDTDSLEHNISDPSNKKYSILSKLIEFKREGKYEFWIFYPLFDGSDGGNIWSQTSNPVTDLVTGYIPIRETYSGMYWGGLEKSGYSGTLIDGSVGSGWWFYAIGTSRYWPSTGTIPGPMRSQGIEVVHLYIK